MEAKRINKNYYEFSEIEEIQGIEVEKSLGFDSYTNTLSYKDNLQKKLDNVLARIEAIELLGFTEDDLIQENIES